MNTTNDSIQEATLTYDSEAFPTVSVLDQIFADWTLGDDDDARVVQMRQIVEGINGQEVLTVWYVHICHG